MNRYLQSMIFINFQFRSKEWREFRPQRRVLLNAVPRTFSFIYTFNTEDDMIVHPVLRQKRKNFSCCYCIATFNKSHSDHVHLVVEGCTSSYCVF